MHFIFGICREVPVKIERETSKLALIGLAILIVALFVFLTFENLDEQVPRTDLIFHAPSSSGPIAGATNSLDLDSEAFW
ncbi:MAG: hypothetical protein GTO24_16160, partial [candidate division Zixibacteria bacterium]|nr:hypothetical protein [candidate division Zixibacteria bacterium]